MKIDHPIQNNVFTTGDDFLGVSQKWKKASQSIVFTNGCFDILHAGHINYLEQASQKGDRLIVGVNSDSSIKKLKGEDRPIIHEEQRAYLMASLVFVDMVVIFEEETPLELIEMITPDVLVKGSDYRIDDIVGGKHVMSKGGKVETIDFVHTISTSEIVNTILKIENNNRD